MWNSTPTPPPTPDRREQAAQDLISVSLLVLLLALFVCACGFLEDCVYAQVGERNKAAVSDEIAAPYPTEAVPVAMVVPQ